MAGKARDHTFKRAGTRILFQITVIIIVVLVAAGLVMYFLISSSQERFVENSIDKQLEADAETVHAIYAQKQSNRTQEYIDLAIRIGTEDLLKAVEERRVGEFQTLVSEKLQEVVDDELVPLEYTMTLLLESPVTEEPLIFAANDQSLIYNWEVPDYLLEVIEEGEPYVLVEDGIPELGLEGDYLIVIGKMQNTGFGFTGGFIGIESLEEYLGETESFYDEEKGNLTLVLVLVVGISILLVILVTFFLLRYLIDREITKPIGELSAAAEKVVEGDLDVQVKVREGEDLEVLKRAFNSMVESWRKYIDRSVGED